MKEKIELMPHHVGKIVYFDSNKYLFDMSDDEYIAKEKAEMPESYPRDFYSDEWHLNTREVMKTLLDNPDKKFTYVEGLDSLCEKCNYENECGDPSNFYHKNKNKFDDELRPPEMEKEKQYDANYVLDLYKRTDWLK